MKNVLVTGAFGFIGSVLCGQLRAEGAHVRGLGRHPGEGVVDEAFPADLCSGPLDPALFAGVDTVFHLASCAESVAEGSGAEEDYFHVNVDGTGNVLHAARKAGVRRFVFFSTVKAMGEQTGIEALDESAAPAPGTPYGRSKLEAEKLVLKGGHVPEPVVLRLPMVYGGKKSGNMQKMIRAVRGRRFPPIPEFGNRRSMIHVDDASRAALLAATHPAALGNLFIVTDGEFYSTRQIYDWIREGLGKSEICCAIPDSVLRLVALGGDMFHLVTRRHLPFDSDALSKLRLSAAYSSGKIRRDLGFHPTHTLRTTMPELIALA